MTCFCLCRVGRGYASLDFKGDCLCVALVSSASSSCGVPVASYKLPLWFCSSLAPPADSYLNFWDHFDSCFVCARVCACVRVRESKCVWLPTNVSFLKPSVLFYFYLYYYLLSLSLFRSLSLFLFLSLSVCLSLSLCVYLSFPLSLSLCVCLIGLPAGWLSKHKQLCLIIMLFCYVCKSIFTNNKQFDNYISE